MVVTVALPVVVALLLELARRRTVAHERPAAREWEWNAVRALAGVAAALYFVGTPVLGSATPLLVGDGAGHALVASALASHGAPHGWIDAIGSGFPVGTHYPPLGFALLAGLVRLGLSPARAVASLAFVTWMLPPLVVVQAARAYGMRPVAALAGALFVVLVEPYASYVGGWPTVVRMGLVSQALGTTLAFVWLASALHARGTRIAGVAALLLVAAHPQIFAGSAIALVVALIAAFDRSSALRLARSLVPATLFALALYGQGALSLAVPFGWPPDLGWLHVGLPPERVFDWLEGELVDSTRPPLLTLAWVFALATLVLRASSRAARAIVLATGVVTLLAVSGGALLGLGLLSVFQPLRMLAILPLLGAAAVVLAADATIELASRIRLRGASLAIGAALFLFAASELVTRSTVARTTLQSQRPLIASRTCEVDGASVPIDDELRARLGALDRGRLAIDLPVPALLCARALGLEIASGVTLTRTTAVGAHVGVAWAAFEKATQAPEALGVRWLLTRAAAVGPGWNVVWTRGPLALAERASGTDRVGAVCVTERWRGREADLRAALFTAMKDAPGDLLGRPPALEHADEPLTKVGVDPAGCDAAEARVVEAPREPGAVDAEITSPAPIDAIVKESALPSWEIAVDGVRVTTPMRVAPGFMAVRIPAGRHRLTAVVRQEPYAWLVTLTALVALASVFVSRGASRTRPSSRPRRP